MLRVHAMKTVLKCSAILLPLAALALGCSKSPEPSTTSPSASAITPPKPVLLPSAPAAANAPFEGEIVVTVKDEAAKKLPASITYDVKGNKVRYVAAAAPVYAIGDMDAQEAYAVGDAQKVTTRSTSNRPRTRRLPGAEGAEDGKDREARRTRLRELDD